MATTMIRDLTKGPVVSQLFRFAMPLFASIALQADRIIALDDGRIVRDERIRR